MRLGLDIKKLRTFSQREGVHRFVKTLIVVGLAYCFAMIMAHPLSFSLGAISSMSSADFSITDMYQIIADGRDVRTLSPDIVIIDVNNCSRDQIAETIELAKLCEPKAIGVDVSFVEQREGDEPLLESFSNTDRIIGAELLGVSKTSSANNPVFEVKHRSWFADSLGSSVTFAAANFPTLGNGGTIRSFKPWFRMTDGTETPAFATAVAMKANPDKASELRHRGNATEAIYYPSTEFKILLPGDIYERGEELLNSVVLIGALNDPGDRHRTPIDSHTSGTLIQAYAINTILQGRYLKQSPRWIGEAVALVITFIFVFTCMSIKTGIRGMILRIMQVTVLYLVLYAGYWFFIERDVVIDFSRSFLMLAFALFSVDIWNGVYFIWKKSIKAIAGKKRDDSAADIGPGQDPDLTIDTDSHTDAGLAASADTSYDGGGDTGGDGGALSQI